MPRHLAHGCAESNAIAEFRASSGAAELRRVRTDGNGLQEVQLSGMAGDHAN